MKVVRGEVVGRVEGQSGLHREQRFGKVWPRDQKRTDKRQSQGKIGVQTREQACAGSSCNTYRNGFKTLCSLVSRIQAASQVLTSAAGSQEEFTVALEQTL